MKLCTGDCIIGWIENFFPLGVFLGKIEGWRRWHHSLGSTTQAQTYEWKMDVVGCMVERCSLDQESLLPLFIRLSSSRRYLWEKRKKKHESPFSLGTHSLFFHLLSLSPPVPRFILMEIAWDSPLRLWAGGCMESFLCQSALCKPFLIFDPEASLKFIASSFFYNCLSLSYSHYT